jgi:hypothetical protein
MKPIAIVALCSAGAFTIALPTLDAQANAPVAQNRPHAAAPHMAVSHPVRPAYTYAHPVASSFARGPMSFRPRTSSSYLVRTVGRPAMNLRTNYPRFTRPMNPTLLEAIRARRIARGENVLATVRNYNSTVARVEPTRPNFGPYNPMPTSTAVQPAVATHARQPLTGEPGAREPGQNVAPNTQEHNRGNRGNHRNFSDALHAHQREWHNRDWWQQHCPTIVFVNTGYYFLDGSYWYPAYGYDPLNSNYDYDGPVYTNGNLLPDEMIANVQSVLQEAGYYNGPISGSLNEETRAALANFQRDQGLEITGAIDESTVETLGLSSQSGY